MSAFDDAINTHRVKKDVDALNLSSNESKIRLSGVGLFEISRNWISEFHLN